MVAKGNRQREGTAQARQDLRHGLARAAAVLDFARDEMDHHLAVGVAFQRPAVCLQFGAQFLEVLNDPVVHQRDAIGCMRVGVLRGRSAMRGPARMRDPHVAGGGIGSEFGDEIVQLAFRAAADQLAIVERTHAGAVIAAVFHAAQAVDQPVGDRLRTDDTDNSAH